MGMRVYPVGQCQLGHVGLFWIINSDFKFFQHVKRKCINSLVWILFNEEVESN